MRSVACGWRSTLGALALVGFLGGCSVVPGVVQGLVPGISFVPAGEGPDRSAGAEDGAVAASGLEPSANPYLLDPPAVPAAARAEFAAALQSLREKDYQLAEARLLQLTQAYPQLSGPWLNLGLLYRDSERNQQAAAALQQALAVNPNNLEAYNQLAILKRQRGDFAAAQADYQAALAIWPQHAASHRNLGILYEIYLGQLPAALHHYQQYLLLQAGEDAEVQAWVVDLQRRVKGLDVASH
ncbi:MAG: tetratricopeptide repeat protein [Gammaproteobacteria bacterium]|nr:tetratricopeptide repeat protein [Gammaproteobacteria bacterium]